MNSLCSLSILKDGGAIIWTDPMVFKILMSIIFCNGKQDWLQLKKVTAELLNESFKKHFKWHIKGLDNTN